jgi:tetratricopeptide (TPR) repeat protein
VNNTITAILRLFLGSLLVGLSGCGTMPEKNKAFTRLEMADQAYAQGRWVEAEQYYQAITQQVPNDFYAWFRLGNARLHQGNVEAAIYAYQAGLERDAQQPKLHHNLAEAYLILAYRSMQAAHQVSDAARPEREVIGKRLKELHQIIYKPIRDLPSPARGLIRN